MANSGGFDFDQRLAMARERLAHSSYKRIIELSNPSLPDYGVDEAFQLSDQRHWTIKCKACGAWTAPVREFPRKIGLEVKIILPRPDGRPMQLSFEVNGPNPIHDMVAEYWKKVGVQMDYKPVLRSVLKPKILANQMIVSEKLVKRAKYWTRFLSLARRMGFPAPSSQPGRELSDVGRVLRVRDGNPHDNRVHGASLSSG